MTSISRFFFSLLVFGFVIMLPEMAQARDFKHYEKLYRVLNLTLGQSEVSAQEPNGDPIILRWKDGFPKGNAHSCLARNGNDELKLFPCTDEKYAVCQYLDNLSPGREVSRASRTFEKTTWFQASETCGVSKRATDLIFFSPSEIGEEDRLVASEFFWTNVILVNGKFTEDHQNNLEVYLDTACSAYLFGRLASTDCVRPPNTSGSSLVCFEPSADRFYYFSEFEVQSVLEAITRCREQGDDLQLPATDDLARLASKFHSYQLDLDQLVLSNPSERDPGRFYVNYFLTTEPMLEFEAQDNQLNQFWASRDLAGFQVWGDAEDWGKPSDWPSDAISWGTKESPRECLSSSGADDCSSFKFVFCRNALHARNGGSPWLLSNRYVEWAQGEAVCGSLSTSSAAYFFDVPHSNERKDLSDKSFWINQKMDTASVSRKRSGEFAFSRAAYFDQGYIASIENKYWAFEALNGNSRCGPPSEIAAKRARLNTFGIGDGTKASLLGPFAQTACSQPDQRKRPRSDITTSRKAIPVEQLSDAVSNAKRRQRIPSQRKPLNIHWFDVGQGQLQVIEPFAPNGPGFIIDAGVVGPDRGDEEDEGSDFDDTIDFLAKPRGGSNMSLARISSAVRRLIGTAPPIVMLSHPDRDHMVLLSAILGCPDVSVKGCPQNGLDYIRPAEIYYGGSVRSYRQDVRSIIDDVKAQETAIQPRVFGSNDTTPTSRSLPQIDGDFRATITTVTANNPSQRNGCSAKNAASLVVEATYGDVSVYFMGDSERLAEVETSRYAQSRVTGFATQRNILTASHHGAETCGSNAAPFAKNIQPEVVVYPAGASGHQHPRCGAVQHYLSYVTTHQPSEHPFGCLAETPRKEWDSDALFYVDPNNSDLNRHAGTDPRDIPLGQQREEVFQNGRDFHILPSEAQVEARFKSVYTTQESGHIKLVVSMLKATPSDEPEPDGYYLSMAKSGPFVRRSSRNRPSALHKRYLNLETQAVDIEEIIEQVDGSYIGFAADGEMYAWADTLNAGFSKPGWIGPLVLSGRGHFTAPGDGDTPMHISATDPNSLMGEFSHMGQFYSNDLFLFDDGSRAEFGNLQECADKCVRTNGCGRFTFAYRYSGTAGQFCTLFRRNAEPIPTESDYQMYERIE